MSKTKLGLIGFGVVMLIVLALVFGGVFKTANPITAYFKTAKCSISQIEQSPIIACDNGEIYSVIKVNVENISSLTLGQ